MIDLQGKDAGGYTRASKDTGIGSDVEGMSVEGQEDDIEVAADELGVNLLEVYNDNNLSGSRFATKERKDWLRMLADIKAGRFEVLIVWELSRGSRKYSEWGTFLDLVEERGTLIHCVTHERTYNPRNHKDMEILQLEGVKSHSESNLISVRVRRGHAKARRKGRPHGTAPFGWQRIYDEKTGKMVTQIPHEGERPFVEAAFTDAMGGGSSLEAAKDWARRNDLDEDDPERVPLTRGGKRWNYNKYREMLLNPVHMGKFVDPKTGEMCDGSWEGFIDEATWWTVNKAIKGSAHPVGSRPAGAKYLLTFIARCGVCRSWMGPGKQRGRDMLVCVGLNEDRSPMPSKGHTSIRMDWADDFVTKVVAKRLCDRNLIAALCAQDTEAAKAARAEAEKIRADIELWRDLAHSRAVDPREYTEYKAKWEPEAERLEEQAASGLDAGAALALELQQMADRAGIPEEDLFELMLDAIGDTALPGQRVLFKKFTKSITVDPATVLGRKTFDPDRIKIE